MRRRTGHGPTATIATRGGSGHSAADRRGMSGRGRGWRSGYDSFGCTAVRLRAAAWPASQHLSPRAAAWGAGRRLRPIARRAAQPAAEACAPARGSHAPPAGAAGSAGYAEIDGLQASVPVAEDRLTTRESLHQLVDALPHEALPAAKRSREAVQRNRGLPRVLAEAPLDDEPLTDEDHADLAEAYAPLASGDEVADEDLERELGW